MENALESPSFVTLLTTPWFLAVVGGTIVLGIAIAYGMIRARQRTRREDRMGEEGTKRLYEEENRR